MWWKKIWHIFKFASKLKRCSKLPSSTVPAPVPMIGVRKKTERGIFSFNSLCCGSGSESDGSVCHGSATLNSLLVPVPEGSNLENGQKLRIDKRTIINKWLSANSKKFTYLVSLSLEFLWLRHFYSSETSIFSTQNTLGSEIITFTFSWI